MLQVEEYSEKSFVVFGLSCQEEIDKLTQAGGLYNPAMLSKKENKRLPGFVFPKYKFDRPALDKLVTLMNSNQPKQPTPLEPTTRRPASQPIATMNTVSKPPVSASGSGTKDITTSMASTNLSSSSSLSSGSKSNDGGEDLRGMMSLFLQRIEVLEAEVRTLKNIVVKGGATSATSTSASTSLSTKKRASPVKLPASGARKKVVTIKEPEVEEENDDDVDDTDQESTSFYLHHLND